MSEHTKITLKNSLREHHKPNFINTIRKLINVRKGSSVGSDVIIDKNVEILRFPKNVSIGNEVILKEGVKICPTNAKAKVNIGNRTTVGYHTMLFASKNIVVGNDCMIAPFAYIVDSNHLTKKDIPMNAQGVEASDIIIGDDVWVGTGVKILPGVRINEGSVIAAGSVVNSDIPKYKIVAGSPAKVIGERT